MYIYISIAEKKFGYVLKVVGADYTAQRLLKKLFLIPKK